MKAIAIIPARGGSKGVPKKNIKLLNEKPLIAYTIEAAKQAKLFERVVVSTDSEEIAEVSKQYGAEVPFLRPAELSGDNVSSDDVILHALQFFEDKGKKYDFVCKLQPTSPLRTSEHIKEAYHYFYNNHYNYVVSVCECEHSPRWSGELDEDNGMEHFMAEEYKRAVRQQIAKYYRLNGAIYIGKTQQYRQDKSFLGRGCHAYIMSQEDSVDIDSMLDFKIAELIMKEKNSNAFS